MYSIFTFAAATTGLSASHDIRRSGARSDTAYLTPVGAVRAALGNKVEKRNHYQWRPPRNARGHFGRRKTC